MDNLELVIETCIDSFFNILITSSIFTFKGAFVAMFPLLKRLVNYLTKKIIFRINNPYKHFITIQSQVDKKEIIKYFENKKDKLDFKNIGYISNSDGEFTYDLTSDMHVEDTIDENKYIIKSTKKEKEDINIIIYSDSIELIYDYIKYIRKFNDDFSINHLKDKYVQYDYQGERKYYKSNDILIKKNFDNVYLPDAVYKNIIHNIDEFIKHTSEFSNLGLSNKRSFLFKGPPGTGKTSTSYALAKKYDRPIYKINLNMIVSDGDLYDAFNSVKKKSIILLEDIDACNVVLSDEIKIKNGFYEEIEIDGKKQKVSKDKFNQNILLNYFDGINMLDDVIIIATTNHEEYLDERFIRPGRMDTHIEFKKCDREQLQKIIKKFLGKELSNEVMEQVIDYKYSPSEIIFKTIIPNLDFSDLDKSYDTISKEIVKIMKTE